MSIQIQQSTSAETPAICELIEAAFGPEQGQDVAQLTVDLLADASAQPILSLVATDERTEIGNPPLGHILFTHARVHSGEFTRPYPAAALLAPLAVRPDVQSQGIGGRLIMAGLEQLKAAGVGLVFVLGHPGYYPRYGFTPAGCLGFDAPYPIPAEHADAWMVQALEPGLIGPVRGQVRCADALGDPRHWQE